MIEAGDLIIIENHENIGLNHKAARYYYALVMNSLNNNGLPSLVVSLLEQVLEKEIYQMHGQGD